MNLRHLQYAIVLSEKLNFSQAAEHLNMSQPSLSKQIMSLEKELGVKLFNRDTNPLSLTPAGEFFKKKAKDILFEKDILVKTMEHYKTGEKGKLIIGVSPFRSLCLMPEFIKELKAIFPSLQIILEEHCLEELKKGLLEGDYDFAIVNLPVDETNFEVLPLKKDHLVLAVPNNLINLIEGNVSTDNKIKLIQCKNIPFVTIGKEQDLRVVFDKLCAIEGLNPNVFLEVTGVTTTKEMVKEGIAAALLPKQFIEKDVKYGNITLFELNQNDYVHQSAVLLRRGQFVSKYARVAIDKLIKNY